MRDFIVGTQRGSIILVAAAVFELVEPEHRRGDVLYQGLPGRITAQYVIRDFSKKHIQEQFKTVEHLTKPIQFICTDRGDLLQYNYADNTILKSVNLVGDINASSGQAALKGSLQQRHCEGFEQVNYLLPVNPTHRIRTMDYAYVTALELFSEPGQKPLLFCGTSLGTCLLLDPISLQLLSSFTHLSTYKQIVVPDKDGNAQTAYVPNKIKFIRQNQGDVVAAVDEQSQLTVLSKTTVVVQKMDLVTGKFNGAGVAPTEH